MDEVRRIIREALEEFAPNSEGIMKDQVAEEILERLQPFFPEIIDQDKLSEASGG